MYVLASSGVRRGRTRTRGCDGLETKKESAGASHLKPMRRVLISDEIIEHIKQLIIEGKLKPGDRLPAETTMASRMNVGRSTIREALKVLIHLGFIERINKVAVVSPDVHSKLHPQDIVERFKKNRNVMEMLETRKIIEPDIAGLAAARCSKADLAELKKDLDSMRETQNDVEAFIIHDHRFHLRLAQVAKNEILIEIVKGLQENLVQTQGIVLRNSRTIKPRSMDYHHKLFSAIEEGKPKLAKKLMLTHILDIEKEMYTILHQDDPDESLAFGQASHPDDQTRKL